MKWWRLLAIGGFLASCDSAPPATYSVPPLATYAPTNKDKEEFLLAAIQDAPGDSIAYQYRNTTDVHLDNSVVTFTVESGIETDEEFLDLGHELIGLTIIASDPGGPGDWNLTRIEVISPGPLNSAATVYIADRKAMQAVKEGKMDLWDVMQADVNWGNAPSTPIASSACTPASSISLAQAGKTTCIYGTVLSVGRDDVAQYVNFQNADFQLITYDLTLAIPYQIGDCIQQNGTIAKLGSRPVIIFDTRDTYTECNAPPPVAQATATRKPSGNESPTSTSSSPTVGQLTIVSTAAYSTHLVLWGPADKTIDVAPGQTVSVQLPAGDYGWTAFSNGCKLNPTDNLVIRPSNTIYIIPDSHPCGSRFTWDAPAPVATQPNVTSSCPNGCTSHIAGCDIKGNVAFNTGEKIYHIPGGEFYNDTVINPHSGERWFCTEADAVANGWRKSER